MSDKPQLRRKLKATLTMTAIAVLLLATSTVIAANSILQSAYADGVTFKKIKQISKKDGIDPQIAVSGKNVYVVWTLILSGGAGDIFFTRSINDGAPNSFSNPKLLSKNPDTEDQAMTPEIAVSGSNVYVVWRDIGPTDPEIYVTRSTNNGARFSDPKNVSDTYKHNSLEPEIAASGRNVYVVWIDEEPGPISGLFTRSTNNGDRFSQETLRMTLILDE